MLALSLSTLLLAAGAMADFVPTAPAPGDAFAADSDCAIQWEADATGKWTNVSISLMTGPNNNVTRLMEVTSSLDGTDEALSSFRWTCPQVEPYSAIYFYRFTNGDDLQGSQWTTRFTIASPTGESEAPENDIQPNGDKISWGIGRLKAVMDALGSGDSSEDVDASGSSDPSSAVTRTHEASKTAAVSSSDIVSGSVATPGSSTLSPSSPTASATASQVSLDSSSRVNRDDIWLRSVSIYSVLVAMLL